MESLIPAPIDFLETVHVYLRVCLCEGNWSARLSVHQSAQSGLALHDAVWDAHLAAQSWQEDNELEKQENHIKKIINYRLLVLFERLDGSEQSYVMRSENAYTLSGLCSGLKSSSIDPHRGFSWRNSNIIASDHFRTKLYIRPPKCFAVLPQLDPHRGQWQPAGPFCSPPERWLCLHLQWRGQWNLLLLSKHIALMFYILASAQG